MREAKKKVGVFNKKPTLEIPKNMEITATSKVYENHSKDTVVYSTNQDSCILTPAFMSLVENVDANKTVMIPLEKSKQKVAYKDVDGFFLYEGIVFYRDKGASGRRGAGRTVKDGTSFTMKIKELHPDMQGSTSTDISKLEVTPLISL